MCWLCFRKRKVEPKVPEMPNAKPATNLIVSLESVAMPTYPAKPKIEEKKILTSHPARPLEVPTKVQRQMVAHRVTRGGNSYGIQVSAHEPEERLPDVNNMRIEYIQDKAVEDEPNNKLSDPMTPENEKDKSRISGNENSGLKNEMSSFQRANDRGQTIVSMAGIPMIDPVPQARFLGSNNSLREITDRFNETSKTVSRVSSTNSKFKNKLSEAEMSESRGKDMSQMEANFTKGSQKMVSRSVSPNKLKRVTGFRTLDYVDLLSLNNSCGSKDQQSHSAKNKDTDEKKDNMKLFADTSSLGVHRSNGGSQKSILVVTDNDNFDQFSRNDFSTIDITMNLDKSQLPPLPTKRRQDRGSSLGLKNLNSNLKQSRKATSTSKVDQNTSIMREDDDMRQNKDLNTTYVYKTEVMGPKKTSRDHGISVTGKVTQINQYIMVSVIGRGGWGEVYLAFHSTTREKFVICS